MPARLVAEAITLSKVTGMVQGEDSVAGPGGVAGQGAAGELADAEMKEADHPEEHERLGKIQVG